MRSYPVMPQTWTQDYFFYGDIGGVYTYSLLIVSWQVSNELNNPSWVSLSSLILLVVPPSKILGSIYFNFKFSFLLLLFTGSSPLLSRIKNLVSGSENFRPELWRPCDSFLDFELSLFDGRYLLLNFLSWFITRSRKCFLIIPIYKLGVI